MFAPFGRFVQRHRAWIVALWAVLVAVSLPLAPRLTTALKTGGFASDDLESVRASRLLEARLGVSPSTMLAVFQSPTLTADDPRFEAAVQRMLDAVQEVPGVERVVAPSLNRRQVAADGHTAYATIALRPPEGGGRRLLAEVEQRLRDDEIGVLLTGAPVFYADIEDVSERDLRRAELLALPLGLLTLLLVMRSLVAAALPALAGVAAVVVAMALLFLLAGVADFSIFVMNMASMLGLGLSIDYALFLASRFREELRRHQPEVAAAITVATAGRAVFFSALTVLTGLLGLLVFDSMMLRSLGIGGAVVVVVAALAALTLLPALLGLLGRRLDSLLLPALPVPRALSWARLARAVMRHPLRTVLPVLVFLIVVGWPFLHVKLGSPDASILPAHLPSRQGYETLRREFGEGELAPILLVVQSEGSILAPENVDALYELTHRLARDSRVQRVESIVDLDPRLSKEQYRLMYETGSDDPFLRQTLAAFTAGDTTLVRVLSKHPMISAESQALVRSIRRAVADGRFRVLVGGGSAGVVDYVDGLYSSAPGAVAIVVLTTYGALFLLFRSIVIPLKAVLMNTLSILASYGALVVVFQDGFLGDFLGFSPAGFIEASLPIVMFCFLFGVSMDYEVFLLSRIKEAYDQTSDNAQSVAEGLERSGRIITSAALIVVVVSASFVAADIVLVKALGLGTAVAVLLDATVVRALLVPATMRLLGDLNWWLPSKRDLRRLLPGAPALRYALFGLVGLALGTVALWGSAGPVGSQAGPAQHRSEPLEALGEPTPAVLPPISLPADEAPHDKLTEWWYYTGHLSAADGSAYGFELVFFQSIRGEAPVGYAAHFAITDRARRAFHYDQRSQAGSRPDQQGGFFLRLGDWQMSGANGHDHLRAGLPGYALELSLAAAKPPVLHAGNGIVSFGPAGDSYYYSRTRMEAAGTIIVDGSAQPVQGTAWMDHQWGNFLVLNKGGWDWFGLQLDTGDDLAISLVRDADEHLAFAYATYVDAAGRATHVPAEALSVTATGNWISPRSGARYPAGWHIQLPQQGLALDATPVLADQELDTSETTGLTYWEGAVELNGKQGGRPIFGKGYVELTGYADSRHPN